jgi:hypothetical protein
MMQFLWRVDCDDAVSVEREWAQIPAAGQPGVTGSQGAGWGVGRGLGGVEVDRDDAVSV